MWAIASQTFNFI